MSRFRALLILALSILPCTSGAGVELPKKGTLNHPYLIMKDKDLTEVRNLVKKDIYARRVDSIVVDFCHTRIKEALPGNERDASGTRLKNVGLINKDLNLFSYAARVHDRADFRNRAIEEMMAVCDFPDWSPDHFLDPSEIAFAVSICYDWFYDCLTPKQRKKIRNALINNAILPSFEKHPDHYFYSPTNWSSVCNCGIVAAALAVMNEDPDDAVKVINRCIKGNSRVISSYDPIGGYPEGYGYWSFGTNHEVMLLEMLEGVFGTDFGLAESSPGFMLTPSFILHMNGPFGKGFNFGDNAPEMRLHPAVFWFAQKNFDPSLFYMEQKFIMSGEDITIGAGYALPAMMVWYSRLGEGTNAEPKDLIYENTDQRCRLFICRSSWSDENSAYLGIRAGSVRKCNHSHIDVGSFVYYQDKVRWIADIGAAKYTLAEKYLGHKPFFTITQESRRWEVFREGAEGHGIVTFDGIRPNINCDAQFTRVFKSKAQRGAMIDLSSMYPDQVASYLRMVYLDNRDDLVVAEKFVGGGEDRTVKGTFVSETKAEMQEDGSIIMTKNGKSKVMNISCPDVKLKVSVDPAATDKPWDQNNPGIILVHYEFPLKAGSTVNMITTLK